MIDSTNPRILADNIRDLTDREIVEAAEILALQGTVSAQGNSIGALQIYDDAETDTGKKWIDNSPIYRKVFINTLPNSTTKSIEHGITDLGVVVSLEAITQPTATFEGRPIANAGSQTVSIDATNIKLYASSNLSAVSVIIIVEYTKAPAPTPDLSPAPDDTRSIEPEEREDEPIIDEPIEEPVVEVKKTTRKKITTTE